MVVRQRCLEQRGLAAQVPQAGASMVCWARHGTCCTLTAACPSAPANWFAGTSCDSSSTTVRRRGGQGPAWWPPEVGAPCSLPRTLPSFTRPGNDERGAAILHTVRGAVPPGTEAATTLLVQDIVMPQRRPASLLTTLDLQVGWVGSRGEAGVCVYVLGCGRRWLLCSP